MNTFLGLWAGAMTILFLLQNAQRIKDFIFYVRDIFTKK